MNHKQKLNPNENEFTEIVPLEKFLICGNPELENPEYGNWSDTSSQGAGRKHGINYQDKGKSGRSGKAGVNYGKSVQKTRV